MRASSTHTHRAPRQPADAAAERVGEQLGAEADAEHRHVALDRLAQQRDLLEQVRVALDLRHRLRAAEADDPVDGVEVGQRVAARAGRDVLEPSGRQRGHRSAQERRFQVVEARERRPCRVLARRVLARSHPVVGVPADRRGRVGASCSQARRGPGAQRRRGPRAGARRRAPRGGRGPPRRDRPPRARAGVPQGRPRRVRALGRRHERRHARGRRGDRRRAVVRPRALARLARRGRGAQAGAALRLPVARDRARDRARPPPGLGEEAPAEAHPRRRAADGARRRPRDHVLALHARARRRGVRDRRGEDHRGAQRRRPRGPAAGGEPAEAARALRGAGRAARAAGRAARLREGLPPRARRAAGRDRARRRRALPRRRVGDGGARPQGAGEEARAAARTASSSAGSTTRCCTRSTRSPTCA